MAKVKINVPILVGVLLLVIFVLVIVGPRFLAVTGTEAANCSVAKPEFGTLECVISAPPGKSSVTQTETFTFDYSHPYTFIGNRGVHYKIYSVVTSGAFSVKDGVDGHTICSGGSGGSSCDNIELIENRPYRFETGLFISGTATIKYDSTFLKYKESGGEWILANTIGCYAADWQAEILQNVPKPVHPILAIFQSQAGTITILPNRTVIMGLGGTASWAVYYTQAYDIGTLIYQNYKVKCTPFSTGGGVLYDYDKITVGNQCVLVPSNNIRYDGRNNNLFCCDTAMCQSVYNLQGHQCDSATFTCTPSNQTTCDQCTTPFDCPSSRFYVAQDGSKHQEDYSCISSCCKANDVTVACISGEKNAQGQCCYKINGVLQWASCQSGLLNCEDLGTSACCLSTQSQYTPKTAPSGYQCCGAEDDGVGTIKKTCGIEGISIEGILKDIGNALGKLFGVNLNDTLSLILGISIVILIAVIIFKLAMPPRLGGGLAVPGAGIGGGQPIIIFKG